MYIPNDRASKYMKKKLTEFMGVIDNSEIIEETSIPYSLYHKTTREKINKEWKTWMILNQRVIIMSITAKYTFFSQMNIKCSPR